MYAYTRFLTHLIFIIIYIGYLLIVAPLSVWMLLNGQTWIGTALAVAGLLLLPLPFLSIRWYRQRRKQKIWGGLLAFDGIVVLGLLIAIFAAAPSGSPGPGSPVQHHFFRDARFSRFSLPNIVPESEQINLGFFLMPYLDSILTPEQANEVSSFTMDLYREMDQDRDFYELGSVMGLAYGELLGRPFDVGHYYLYVPENKNEEPLPAVVFLHGSVGNFKTYTWVWSKFAEEEGFVIIAPSYGFGNWNQEGIDTVLEAIENAKLAVDIDENRLYLAGLSNGGLSVSHIAAAEPAVFQGLILISPVMSTQIVDGQPFQEKWANRPVLVISGALDRRVPINYVENRISRMRGGDVEVSSVIYPNEDHFLFFSQSEKIMTDVSDWLSGIEE